MWQYHLVAIDVFADLTIACLWLHSVQLSTPEITSGFFSISHSLGMGWPKWAGEGVISFKQPWLLSPQWGCCTDFHVLWWNKTWPQQLSRVKVFSNFPMVFAVISEVLICLWIFLTWGLLLEEFNLRHLIPHEILDATAIVKHKILSINDDLCLCQHVGPPNRCLPESLLKDTRVLLLTSYINSGLHIIIWELVGRHTVPSSSGILIIIWIYLISLSVCVPLDQY